MQGWRILDFLSHYPESCHILTWLLDEPGIPADWVSLEGMFRASMSRHVWLGRSPNNSSS